MKCSAFIESNQTSSMGKQMDSFLMCGRTAKAHLPPDPPIYEIHWGGKAFLKTAEELSGMGFHL